MNSSSNILNSMDTFEGFTINYHGIMSSSNYNEFADHHHHPMSYDDQMLTMTRFFPSGHGCSSTSMMPETDQIIGNSSPSVSGAAFLEPQELHKHQNHGGKKRKRTIEREIQKPKDVVHVRAKRGQATDSHSLAERLRREKINDKLRCLQDLVPGCYKTMGMAVMLDVIINYVQSLQNQIDFLSMKLSAASLFFDFNSSEAEAVEALQGTTGYEGGTENIAGDGYGGISQFPLAAWPL